MKRIVAEWPVLISPKRRLRSEVRRANAARDQRDWAVAAEAYRGALRLAPKDARLWMQAGHALKENGNLAGAREAYARAEALAPGDVDTHIQLGHFHKLLGEDVRAVWHYQAAVNNGSTDIHALHFLAAKNLAPAEAGEHPVSCLAKADIARDAGMFERAAQLYQEAAQADPRSATFVQLGNCLKESGSLIAAQRAYLSALDLDPDDADCLLQLGHLMKVMGDTAQAKFYFEQSARLDPDRPDAETELAALRARGLPLHAAEAPISGPPPAHRDQIVNGTVAVILQHFKSAQAQRRI